MLADPWVYTKKRSIVDVIDGFDFAEDGPVQMPAVDPMQELQKTVQLNNCSNVVVNVYLAK